MAKKNFKNLVTGGRDTEKNVSQLNNYLKNAESSTVEKIQNIISDNININNTDAVIQTISNDRQLTKEEKERAIDYLKEQFVEYFNFDNCPDDYSLLKKEAKFLAGMTQYSFLLMAQRLLKIRDNELFVEDGYKDFKSFIENEMSIARRTAYNYIDLIECFGVQTFALNSNIEYSKLLPAIPILKSNNIEIPKNEIKNQFINEAKTKSAREIQEDAKELKIKYGILKNAEDSNYTDKLITEFISKLPKRIIEGDREKLRDFKNRIEKIIEF